MKRIGIITYHRSRNYGAQLQAYASRTALQHMGHEAEIIDCNHIGQTKSLFSWHCHSFKAFCGSLRNNVLALISERKRARLFAEFSRNAIGRSAPCHTRAELEQQCQKYDAVITGSDQVWHPGISEGNTIFFLDLPLKSEQKIAYAPSFGVSEYTEEQAQRYMPLINDIAHLSAREQAGQELIRRHTGREAQLVLDPTMLLTRDDWEQLAKPAPYKKPYLFYFTILNEPAGLDALVRRIATERGLQIVRIGSLKDILKRGFINARANGPREFLGLIRDADFVVTTSFHGSVFSILFEKEFLCVLNNNNRNSRLQTLADQTGLSTQVVHDVGTFDFKRDYRKPDYDTTRQLLCELKESSLNFLHRALS